VRALGPQYPGLSGLLQCCSGETHPRRIHEKAIAKEIAERRKLLNLVFRGADAALVRNPRDPAKREALIARAKEASLELQRRRSGPK
jgi:hypothetical protein